MSYEKEVQLNDLSWKLSMKNYSATAIGSFIYGLMVIVMVNFWSTNSESLGILSPVVLIFIIQLAIKLMFLIPRPISTYEVVEIKK